MNKHFPDYEPLSVIGSGVFGYVIEAYDRINDKRVAIKRTYKSGTKISREYEILKDLKSCQYIIELLDIFYTYTYINKEKKIIQNLVFEYIKYSLENYIKDFRDKEKFIPIINIKKIFKQILLGLEFCHNKKIIHRDLKPENILISEELNVKICDFGSAKYITENSSSTPFIVSRYHRPPELILGECKYNEKIDIFSAGCILAELLTLTPLFKGK